VGGEGAFGIKFISPDFSLILRMVLFIKAVLIPAEAGQIFLILFF
jgi:hypothetical protein